MYRLYFVYPASDIPIMPSRFEPDGFKAYYDWLKGLLAGDILGSGIGMADLAETQPIFGNTYNAVMYFDFDDRIKAFDAIDKHGFVEVLDKMLDFTDTPPVLQGIFMMDQYIKAPAAQAAPVVEEPVAEGQKKNLSHLLEKYVDRMNAHDVNGITDLWIEGGVFDDVSAKLLTGKPGYCVGAKQIRNTFRKMFIFKPKANIIKMYDNGLEMDYDIHIIGKTLPCHGKIVMDQDNKFMVYACTPREE